MARRTRGCLLSATEERALTGALHFEALRRAFGQAAGDGVTERTVAVAGRLTRLLFADERVLGALYPALRHLEVEDAGDPWLTIMLWSGPPAPELPWAAGGVDVKGGVLAFEEDGVRTQVDPSCGLLASYFPDRREVLVWVEDVDEIGWHERSSPLRWMFNWAYADARTPLVHAGAVGRPGAGALLVGPSGSGKSLTALACAAAGLDFVGDDYVLVSLDPEPVAHSLFCMARVVDRDVERVPGLADAVAGWAHRGGTKGAVDVPRLAHASVRRGLPLRSVVLPRVTRRRRARLRRVSGARALRGMAPSTLFQLPADHPGITLSAMAEIVRRLPVYELELGGEPADAARELALLCADG